MSPRFKPIDLLFVVGVVFILFGLMVGGRNSGHVNYRDAQCANNLRQLGLGLTQYMTVHGVFPMSAVEGEGHGRGQSCFALILPYIDQIDTWQAYDFGREPWSNVPNWHAESPSNAQISATMLGLMTCPSNPNRNPVPTSLISMPDGTPYPLDRGAFAPSHYAANWGGGRQGLGTDFESTHGNYRGTMMTIRSLGPKGANHCIGAKDIPDGLSSTILLGEKRDSLGWNAGGRGGSEFDVGPSPGYSGEDHLIRKVYTGSYHNGRTNFSFADGSVRALPDTLDRKIWYSLITRDGGESASFEN